jgi:hypothetical protein
LKYAHIHIRRAEFIIPILELIFCGSKSYAAIVGFVVALLASDLCRPVSVSPTDYIK